MEINDNNFLDLARCKYIANISINKIVSDYCWLFNDISKEWHVVHVDHLKEYPDPSKLEYYFTLRKNY